MCASLFHLTSDAIVQVPGGPGRRICDAPQAARRAYDQADILRLCADCRRGEEVASQFVIIQARSRIRSLTPVPDAYWTQETLDRLLTVDDIPELRSLDVPPGTYLCARTNRMRETVSRSSSHLFSGGTVLRSPSASPGCAPYQSLRRPNDRGSPSASLSTSPISNHFTHGAMMAPRIHVQGHGLSLAPLQVLEECRRLRRDPADEVILRSFN